MKTYLLIACVISLPSLALAKPAAVDQKFVKEAACGGKAEVMMGKLALEKSKNESVRSFAQKMIDDHSAANQKLESVAQAEGLTVPAEVGPKEQKVYDKLAKLDGKEFDLQYMKAMQKDHDEDVKEFEKASTTVKSASLRDFVTTTLPTLREHDKMAHDSDATK